MRNWPNHLPIKLAAIPVGAKSNTFGLNGWSPCICKINSENWAINEMRKLFPTPPPPKKENSMHVQGDQDHFLCKEMLISPSILKLHKNPWIWEGLRTIHFI